MWVREVNNDEGRDEYRKQRRTNFSSVQLKSVASLSFENHANRIHQDNVPGINELNGRKENPVFLFRDLKAKSLIVFPDEAFLDSNGRSFLFVALRGSWRFFLCRFRRYLCGFAFGRLAFAPEFLLFRRSGRAAPVFLVVSQVKSASLEDQPAPRAHNAFEGPFPALWANDERVGRHLLKFFEFVSAFTAAVFIGWHSVPRFHRSGNHHRGLKNILSIFVVFN